MKYAKIYADDEGETHFEDVEIGLESIDEDYSESLIKLSSIYPATQYGFFVFPSGFDTNWHPAPRKQILILLSGEMELQVSDGESRHLHAGSIVLTEDATGKGGHHKVYYPLMDEKGYKKYILKTIIKRMMRDFPEETKEVLKENLKYCC